MVNWKGVVVSWYLIVAVGLIYFAVSVEQFIKGNAALGYMYFGYAFANIGAYMLVMEK